MRALSIRQPFAELILRGIKTVELRSRSTNILGERFYIYAAKTKWSVQGGQWPVKRAENIVAPGTLAGGSPVPPWMIELAEQVGMIEPGALEQLPRGVIVGSAVIERVEEVDCGLLNVEGGSTTQSQRSTINHPQSTLFKWHLAGVERARGTLRKPRRHPQPVWFKPF